MVISVTYVPTEIADRIDDMAGLVKKHQKARVIEIASNAMLVEVVIHMGDKELTYSTKLKPDSTNHNALANWLGAQNLLRWYRRIARANEIRAKLGLPAWS